MRLGDIAEVYSGYAFKSSAFGDIGVPVIKIGNIRVGHTDLSDAQYVDPSYLSIDKKYHVSRGDLLISLTGSHLSQPNSVVGRVAWHQGSLTSCLLNQRAGKIRIRRPDIYDLSFLFYVLSTNEMRRNIAVMASGAASQANISPGQVESIEIPVPPLSTQRKIAAILSAYDDLIENNTRRIKILEEMAQSLYREWFVHFRFPGHEGVRLVESELGLVPEGWEVTKLGNAIELAYGKALKAENRIDGSIPVYGSGGIVGYHNTKLVEGPGIIVGRKGNVGSVFWSEDGFCPIDTVFFVRTAIPLHYIYYNLLDQNFINNDAAVPGLNRNQAYRNVFLLPRKEIVTEFEQVVGPVFTQVRLLTAKNANLRRTRDLLLPKLISGEVVLDDEPTLASESLSPSHRIP